MRKVLAQHSCKVYSEQEMRGIAKHYTGSADYNRPLPQLRGLIADLQWVEEVESNCKTLFEFCTVKPGDDPTLGCKLLGLIPMVRL